MEAAGDETQARSTLPISTLVWQVPQLPVLLALFFTDCDTSSSCSSLPDVACQPIVVGPSKVFTTDHEEHQRLIVEAERLGSLGVSDRDFQKANSYLIISS